jgi:hypothetical protein
MGSPKAGLHLFIETVCQDPRRGLGKFVYITCNVFKRPANTPSQKYEKQPPTKEMVLLPLLFFSF